MIDFIMTENRNVYVERFSLEWYAVQNKYDLVNPHVFKINGIDFNIGNSVLK